MPNNLTKKQQKQKKKKHKKQQKTARAEQKANVIQNKNIYFPIHNLVKIIEYCQSYMMRIDGANMGCSRRSSARSHSSRPAELYCHQTTNHQTDDGIVKSNKLLDEYGVFATTWYVQGTPKPFRKFKAENKYLTNAQDSTRIKQRFGFSCSSLNFTKRRSPNHP